MGPVPCKSNGTSFGSRFLWRPQCRLNFSATLAWVAHPIHDGDLAPHLHLCMVESTLPLMSAPGLHPWAGVLPTVRLRLACAAARWLNAIWWRRGAVNEALCWCRRTVAKICVIIVLRRDEICRRRGASGNEVAAPPHPRRLIGYAILLRGLCSAIGSTKTRNFESIAPRTSTCLHAQALHPLAQMFQLARQLVHSRVKSL